MTFFTDKIVTNEVGGSQSDTPVRMDLVPAETLLKVAEVLATGADKYGADNWRLIPTNDHINHATAHLYGHLAGDTSEQHLLNAICRCMFAATTAQIEEPVTKENSFITKVKEFNDKFRLSSLPYVHTDARVDELLVKLIDEELGELKDALDTNTNLSSDEMSVNDVQDALGDLLYVVLGAAIRWEFDIEGIFNEIHRSNMTKLDANGDPVYREDGKLLKGPNYTPPTLGSQFCL